jgi:hypothetical protein
MADFSDFFSAFEDNGPVTTRGRRVVFFPFPQTGGDFPMIEHPNRFREKPTVDPVRSWDRTTFVSADSKWDVLSTTLNLLTSNKDSLYVMGQCLAGSDKFYSLHMKFTIDADSIVTMLGYHLKKEFPGKVKVYACHSSTGGPNKEPPFAKLFADAMRTAGYTQCTYYGYNAQVSGFASKEYRGDASIDDTSGQHKWTMSGANAGQRASASREEIPVG